MLLVSGALRILEPDSQRMCCLINILPSPLLLPIDCRGVMRDKINRMKIGSLHMQSPYIGIRVKIADVNLRSSKVTAKQHALVSVHGPELYD